MNIKYFVRFFLLSLPLLLLSACAKERERLSLLNGPGVEIDASDINTYATTQNQVLLELAAMAKIDGPGLPKNGSEDWKLIVNAGINYIDGRCNKYIDAIFWWDRARNTARSQLNLVGTAATGVMGITGAAASEIAITAVAFGLMGESVDNLGSSVLYRLQPSAVRGIIEKTQSAYKIAIEDTKYTNQPGTVRAISGYLSLCLPTTIEAQVNNSVAGAKIESSSADKNQAPVINVGFAQSQVVTRVSEDLQSRRENAAAFIKGLSSNDLDTLATAIDKEPGTNALSTILSAIASANTTTSFEVINQKLNILFGRRF